MTMQRLEKETRTLFSDIKLEMIKAKDLMQIEGRKGTPTKL
jgi:hypothetical protein